MKNFIIWLFISIFILCLLMALSYAPTKTVKVRILENGSVTYCNLHSPQEEILKIGDTVWVNIAKHQVNDVDSNTMLAIIIPNK